MVAETADDLLRRANALRGAGSYREAERTYLEVTSAHPSTHAAYVARVAAAALRLEHLGDPGGAVRLYRSAIVHGGALDAEARAGLARAYARLGRDAEEAEAWRGLLARHPSSPFAGRARSRLAELEAAP
jgi:tetratricopeptide (TPR) repeat protein